MLGRGFNRKMARDAIFMRIAPWFGMGIVCLCSPIASGDEVSLVRDQITTLWRGFDSFECVAIETVTHQPPEPEAVTTTAFAWRMDGRSSLSWTRETAGATEKIDAFDVREDGSKRVHVQYFKTPPKAIDHISISPCMNGPGRYGGFGFTAFRLFMPAGRTVADVLENGGVLENQGTSQAPRWTLTVDLDRGHYECVLDEAHQFLPREITIDKEATRQILHVERFARSNGFWYPAQGSRHVEALKDHSRIEFAFTIERAVVNGSIPDARFAWGHFPKGASVQDQRDHSVKSIGGRLARLKLQNEHPSPKQPPPANEPIQVPSAPDARIRWWTTSTLMGTAFLAGGLGAYLRRRGL